jgi:hypothetical protein
LFSPKDITEVMLHTIDENDEKNSWFLVYEIEFDDQK